MDMRGAIPAEPDERRLGSTTELRPAVGGFVLAGGQSRRMGRDKAFLKLRNQTLALRAAHVLRPLTGSVTLLGPERLIGTGDIAALPDDFPSQGPLGAICTALRRSAYE